MQDHAFKNLVDAISADRLNAYAKASCVGQADVVARSIWNMALCEAFYPLLHALEVGLRNATDRAMVIKYGKRWLEDNCLGMALWQRDAVTESIEALKLKRPPDHGRIVAERAFGFWTSLYNRRFEHAWHGVLKHAFPNIKGSMRTRRTIATRLEGVRRFRNRVFHHERIIHCKPMRYRTEIINTVGWISAELADIAMNCERVQKVYDAGPTAFAARVAAMFGATPDQHSP